MPRAVLVPAAGRAIAQGVGRVGRAALVVLGATVLLIALSSVVPGNPADTLLGPQASPDYARRFVAEMGLDRPLPERVVTFVGHALRGDLGADVITGRPVTQLVGRALPWTLSLTAVSIGAAILLGLPLGCFAALRPGSLADTVLAVLSVGFIAIPSFVIAIGLLVAFTVWLDWLPVLGEGAGGFWDGVLRMILPATALGLGWVGTIARLTRAGMLDVLGQNYIRTARAYGIRQQLILWKYALKNACIPTLAVLGVGVGRLLGGAVLVEIVFARPGIGKLVLDAINTRNYPVLQGAVLVVVVLFVAVNLVVDLLYGWLDPRTRRAG